MDCSIKDQQNTRNSGPASSSVVAEHDRVSIGYSPCPNDTFIFCDLAHNRQQEIYQQFSPPLLADVETLNTMAMRGQGELDVTKLSFHAFGYVRDRYVLLDAGSALGRGCGPLLVGRIPAIDDLAKVRIAIPGQFTTAAMLLRLFAPEADQLTVMRFDQIMPAISRGEVDAGVIIHESRFTYQQHNLHQLCDLGQWWEDVTGCAIPLGGIAARRDLPAERLLNIQQAVRQSVQWAFAHRPETLPYIRQHAQELADHVVESHVNLYVNDFSIALGAVGKQAVREFLRRGEEASIFPASDTPLFLDTQESMLVFR